MKRGIVLPVMAFFVLLLSGCGVATGIFKAGMLFTIIIIVVVVALIFWIINKVRK